MLCTLGIYIDGIAGHTARMPEHMTLEDQPDVFRQRSIVYGCKAQELQFERFVDAKRRQLPNALLGHESILGWDEITASETSKTAEIFVVRLDRSSRETSQWIAQQECDTNLRLPLGLTIGGGLDGFDAHLSKPPAGVKKPAGQVSEASGLKPPPGLCARQAPIAGARWLGDTVSCGLALGVAQPRHGRHQHGVARAID